MSAKRSFRDVRLACTAGILIARVFLGEYASARAEPLTAEEWNAAGVQHRKKLEPERALEAFRRAHELNPSPKTCGQMGFVEHDLRQYLAAEQHLVDSLAATADPWVVKNRRFLEEALALTRQHLGHVTVRGPPGATVKIHGAPVGTLPLNRPVSLEEGETWIAVTAAGFLPWDQRLTITGGRDVEVVADLVPDRRELPGLSSQGGKEPDLTGQGDNTDDDGKNIPRFRKGAWSLLGVAAVLAGAAAWTYVSRSPDCPTVGMRVCNRGSRPAWPSLLLAGGSAAAAASGITLFWW